MTRRAFHFYPQSIRFTLSAFLMVALLLAATSVASAQTSPQNSSCERTYHQSKNAVEKALKELQPAMSGRLPALEGFALPADHPLNRYQRAYYQSTVQVTTAASGESVVRVSTKVTAWFADSAPAHSGYQLLTSNGRLESDLLDQLTDLLSGKTNAESSGQSAGQSADQRSNQSPSQSSNQSSTLNFPTLTGPAGSTGRATKVSKAPADANLSSAIPEAPAPSGLSGQGLPSQGLSGQHSADTKNSPEPPAQTSLQAEAASLEEVLKNQAHPKNLVAIKKSGTPVVATPSLTAKTLFAASAHDEFEMLDFNADWVHVRISGLSRGWIWRTSLEMPEGISDVPLNTASSAPVAADLFQISREETAAFPGDWEPLRGKNVKIISVQKIHEGEDNSGAQAKLEYAKSLLEKNYAELSAKSQELFGVVLIFDSVDGGMIAATVPTVRQWKAGRLSDAGLWHQCYFDPPEVFNVSNPPSGH